MRNETRASSSACLTNRATTARATAAAHPLPEAFGAAADHSDLAAEQRARAAAARRKAYGRRSLQQAREASSSDGAQGGAMTAPRGARLGGCGCAVQPAVSPPASPPSPPSYNYITYFMG